jgi:hypothetical protein
MSAIHPRLPLALACSGLLALAACGDGNGNNLAALDNSLAGNDADPALTSALEDQIMVDPNLAQQAHPNQARPPETPVRARYPAGTATRRVAEAVGGRGEPGACGARFQYGAEWANRLPAAFPSYPGGHLTEAAGNNAGDCRVRVVTFTTSDPWQRVLAFYEGVAQRGGYDAERQVRGGDHVLGGVNARTDGAYYLIVTPRPNGSEVALIVNNGR